MRRMYPKILSVHRWLDSHPIWKANTISILAFDSKFYQRSFFPAKVFIVIRSMIKMDICVLYYDMRFAFVCGIFIRLFLRKRVVFFDVYPPLVSQQKNVPLRKLPKYWSYRLFINLMDILIVHSTSDVLWYADFFHVAPSKFRFVPYFVYYDPSMDVQVNWSVRWRAGYILCAGRHRDLRTLINAVKGIHRKCVILAGKEDIDELENIVVSGNNLELHVEVGADTYYHFFEGAAVVVLPFYADRWLRSLGHIASMQAAWREIPVITSRTPHLKDYFTEGREVVCYHPEDSRDLQEKLNLVLNEEDYAYSVAQKARTRVITEFTRDNYVQRALKEIMA